MIHNVLTEYASANAEKANTTNKERITKFGYKVPWNIWDAYNFTGRKLRTSQLQRDKQLDIRTSTNKMEKQQHTK